MALGITRQTISKFFAGESVSDLVLCKFANN
ncbi:hypothetical protein [Nostoc sp. UCD120]|nr:hypothetical protein [Nostoc sp. UCD120]